MRTCNPLALLSVLTLVACAKGDHPGQDTDVASDSDTVGDTDSVADTDPLSDTDVIADTDAIDTDVADTDVVDTDVADTDVVDTDLPTFAVHVTVASSTGQGLVLRLGDQLAPVAGDGTVTFARGLTDGADYDVVVAANPMCPAQACTVSDGSGTVSGADVDVQVTCGDALLRLFTSSWGDDAVRVTDDLRGLADGATATPRVIVGANTGITNTKNDSIAVDASRDTLYVADSDGHAVRVWEHASTISGDIAPDRVFTLPSGEAPAGIEVDPTHDRVYVGSYWHVFAFDHASTLSGAATPAATAEIGTRSLSLDRLTDRLYVGGDFTATLSTFDGASTLTGTVTADRTTTWTPETTGFKGLESVVVDACHDRVYLGSNWPTPAGASVAVFDGASGLSGAVDLDLDSDATATGSESVHLFTDGSSHLYSFTDSALNVLIFDDAATWTGAAARTPTKVVLAVAHDAYGGELVAY